MHESLDGKVKLLESKVNDIADQLSKALKYISNDPEGSLGKSRTILEKILLDVYKIEMNSEPKKFELGAMLNDNQFTRKIQRNIVSRMNAIRDMANLGVHGEIVNDKDAKDVLNNLCEVIEWYIDNYRHEEMPEVIHAGTYKETAVAGSTNLSELQNTGKSSAKGLDVKEISRTEIIRMLENRTRYAIQLNANQRAKSKILKAKIDPSTSIERDGIFIFSGKFTAENPLRFLFNYPFNYTGKFRGETYDCMQFRIRELSFSSFWEKIKGISWVDVRQELIDQSNNEVNSN
jgi:hypothetical protein